MGSLNASNPASVPAWMPDIPPISLRELTVGLIDLLRKADGLTLPRYAAIYEPSQTFGLQFDKSAASYQALAAWAQRFGAVLTSENQTDDSGQPCTYVCVTFGFFGVEVIAYAFIPVTETDT